MPGNRCSCCPARATTATLRAAAGGGLPGQAAATRPNTARSSLAADRKATVSTARTASPSWRHRTSRAVAGVIDSGERWHFQFERQHWVASSAQRISLIGRRVKFTALGCSHWAGGVGRNPTAISCARSHCGQLHDDSCVRQGSEWSGCSPGDRWPAATGSRRHSSADFKRLLAVWTCRSACQSTGDSWQRTTSRSPPAVRTLFGAIPLGHEALTMTA